MWDECHCPWPWPCPSLPCFCGIFGCLLPTAEPKNALSMSFFKLLFRLFSYISEVEIGKIISILKEIKNIASFYRLSCVWFGNREGRGMVAKWTFNCFFQMLQHSEWTGVQNSSVSSAQWHTSLQVLLEITRLQTFINFSKWEIARKAM